MFAAMKLLPSAFEKTKSLQSEGVDADSWLESEKYKRLIHLGRGVMYVLLSCSIISLSTIIIHEISLMELLTSELRVSLTLIADGLGILPPFVFLFATILLIVMIYKLPSGIG